ncbi:hypothetical protein BU26DRAFT_160795 [Trematosphaeria pertusa]|uniref:Uncharacterized protein n=1 Tax=Trematosphaeria pertusa TaxID=390896 RepID=A0A6A6HWF4_9PLEO|nr:uncharacterized protein BU26DRAFT_160795 [Trematosphaeria pertusa]KAF2242416.1 hypothetical protein BU26DRAFT_160795 [Trematosphaeria pertusa]
MEAILSITSEGAIVSIGPTERVLSHASSSIAVLLVSSAIFVKRAGSALSVGVGLIAILGFGDRLNRWVIEWTTLETDLGAIARLESFASDIPADEEEDADAFAQVLEDWPQNGDIESPRIRLLYPSPRSFLLSPHSLKILDS